jgi:ATP-dependent helicase HrpB
VLPLHGELNPRDQDAAVERYDRRKVVVSTNVAETSLTIDGIRLVIDSGLARISRFDPYRGINTLLVEKISQASADQRTGRAGRTAPGDCYRLWSEAEHRDRLSQEKPEVQRLDLSEVVLTLKAAGFNDLQAFRWLEPPDAKRLAHAEELLLDLGALEKSGGRSELRGVSPHPQSLSPGEKEEGAGAKIPEGTSSQVVTERGSHSSIRNGVEGRGEEAFQLKAQDERGSRRGTSISEIGRRMLAFPLHPRYARMLIAADELGCVYQACLIAALTQGRDLMIRKVDRDAKDRRGDTLGEKSNSDFFRMMNAWKFAAENKFDLEACKRMGIHAQTARQVGPLLDQFLRIAGREDLDVRPHEVPDEVLQKCVLAGFSDRVARRLDAGSLRCEMVHGRTGVLARESSVHHSNLFVAAEVREIGQHGGEVNTIFSQATAIEQGWLEALFPDDIESRLNVWFDAQSRRVLAAEQKTFRGLALESSKVEPPPIDRAAELLAQEVMAGRLKLKLWDDSVDQWIVRLNRLADWCPDFELPKIGEEDRRALIEQICHGAFGYKEIKECAVKPVVKAWLNDMQHQLLNDHAPERLKFSNGRTPRVIYSENDPPYVSLRIQELFDVKEVPKIAMGRVTVLLHILAPNMRPVQITQDLAGFWRDHYPRVKSELQRKYPKHKWPDVV